MVTAEKMLDNQKNGGYICATMNAGIRKPMNIEHKELTLCRRDNDGVDMHRCHYGALRL